jgi:integrase
MRQKFYIFKRKGNPQYFARFVEEAGNTITERSTGCTSRDEAIFTVSNWLRDGLPPNHRRGNKPRHIETEISLQSILKAIAKADTLDAGAALEIVKALRERGLIDTPAVKAGPGGAEFVAFLEKFWDYEKSPYIRDKLAHGHSFGKRHSYEMENRIKLYWKPAFQGKKINAVTKAELKEFSLGLSDKKLSPASINKIMMAGTAALAWAFREGIIPANPADGLVKFTGKVQQCGILTMNEAAELFKTPWKPTDLRSYTASYLAALTGLRIGEVIAVRKNDIQDNILMVDHSWSPVDGLKCPKNGEPRKVPLYPEIVEALEKLIKQNPFTKTDNPFVFYSTLEDKPMDAKLILSDLKKALDTLNNVRKAENPSAELVDWKARRICFHSWRHWYIAYISKSLEKSQAMGLSGHLSESVFDHYADHGEAKDLDAAREVGAKVFSPILQFDRKGA